MKILSNIEVEGPIYNNVGAFLGQQWGGDIEVGLAGVTNHTPSAGTFTFVKCISFKNPGGGTSSLTFSTLTFTSAEGLTPTYVTQSASGINDYGFKFSVSFNISGKDTLSFKSYYTRR